MLGTYIGAQPFFNDAVAATAVQLKKDAGQIFWLRLINTTANPAYLQVFDQLAANVTVGTTAAKFVIRLAASESLAVPLPVPLELGRLQASNPGISMAGTTTAGGNTPAAISVAALYE